MVLAHHRMFKGTPEFFGGTGRESLDGDLPLKANLFVLWKQEPPFVPQVANASWNAAAGPVVVANCQLHFREHPLVFHLHLDLVQNYNSLNQIHSIKEQHLSLEQLVSVRGSVEKEPERNKDMENSLKLDVPMVQVDANVDNYFRQRVFILVNSCVVLLRRLICVLNFKIKFSDK